MENNIMEMMKLVISELKETRKEFRDFKKQIESELTDLKEDFAKYEDNYRPTHKNKLDVNKYMKTRLGDSYEDGEVEQVQDRVLLMFKASKWQDIPVDDLVSGRGLAMIDDSIMSVIKFRTKNQTSLFDSTSEMIKLDKGADYPIL